MALVLALMLSGGTYAYTYTTASATLTPEAAEGDFATCNAMATQPDWDSVLDILDEYAGWVYWPEDDNQVQLSHIEHQVIIIPQMLEELEITHSHHLEIILRGYVESISISHSEHITIWAEQGYGDLEQEHSHHLNIIVGPAPGPPPGLPRGDVPTGDLFEITPDSAYTGDLLVQVYLTNADDLTKAYHYLNMKLYLEGSVEAGETPNYQLLTLDNGAATFNLPSGGGINHTLSVIGGSYGLNSSDPYEWGEGWSVTPELCCEATQR